MGSFGGLGGFFKTPKVFVPGAPNPGINIYLIFSFLGRKGPQERVSLFLGYCELKTPGKHSYLFLRACKPR